MKDRSENSHDRQKISTEDEPLVIGIPNLNTHNTTRGRLRSGASSIVDNNLDQSPDRAGDGDERDDCPD